MVRNVHKFNFLTMDVDQSCIHFLIVRVRLTYCTKYSQRWTFLFFCFGCRTIAGPGSTIRMWFHGSTPVVWWRACRRQACSAERSLLPSSLCQPGTICQHRNDTQEAHPSLPAEAKTKTLFKRHSTFFKTIWKRSNAWRTKFDHHIQELPVQENVH